VRRLLVNLSLSLVVSVAFLAGLEGLARLFEEPRPARREVAGYLWDWDYKMPGGFYVMRSEAVGWPPWQEFNSDGLRDRTRPREKTEGLWRVAVLGDSVTLGDGIRPRQAYPQQLEARLQAEGQRVEVMNVALWGWSTRQQRTAWERIVRAYRPDQVILAVCLNDIAELHNNLARPPRWLIRLHEGSALVRRLVDAGGREIEDVERLFETPDAPQVKEAMDRFFEEVRALRREVEADGAVFSAVVFPFRFQLEEDAPEPVAQERIAAFCEAEGFPCLDLLPPLQRAGRSSFSDYDHLSPAGSGLTAETLLVSGLLPDGYSSPTALQDRFRGSDEAGGADILRWLEERESSPGEAGVRALATALEDGDLSVRLAAAWALETLGPEARARRRILSRCSVETRLRGFGRRRRGRSADSRTTDWPRRAPTGNAPRPHYSKRWTIRARRCDTPRRRRCPR
jgi:lysophospholipase L1-like esterase